MNSSDELLLHSPKCCSYSVSYVVSIVSILEKIDRIILAPYCILR